MKTQQEPKQNIEVRSIQFGQVTIPIKGTTPLLMDRFTIAAQRAILDKQTGQGTKTRENRDLKKEVVEAIHVSSEGTVGFPVHGFLKGMIDAVTMLGTRTFTKKHAQAIKIINAQDGLIPIKYKKQDILQHNIKHNIKFSPQFHDWTCNLIIKYDANNISPRDIVTLLNHAGFGVGIGAWRPRCRDGGTGTFGMYEVAKEVSA